MASFLEGVAQGLMRQQEYNRQAASDRRADAIALAGLANSAEELEIKRQARADKEGFNERVRNAFEARYGYDEEVAVPVQGGAIPPTDANGNPVTQTEKRRSYYAMGDNTSEGIARDLAYTSDILRAAMETNQITPEMMKQNQERVQYLQKRGIDVVTRRLLANPNDQEALTSIEKMFGADPGSVQVTVGENGQRMVTGTSNGQPLPSQNLMDLASAFELDSIAKQEAANRTRRKDDAAIAKDEALTKKYGAEADYYGAYSGKRGESPAAALSNAMKNMTFNTPFNTGRRDGFKDIPDNSGKQWVEELSGMAITEGAYGDGYAAASAIRQVLNNANQQASTQMAKKIDDEIANWEARGYESKEAAEVKTRNSEWLVKTWTGLRDQMLSTAKPQMIARIRSMAAQNAQGGAPTRPPLPNEQRRSAVPAE